MTIGLTALHGLWACTKPALDATVASVVHTLRHGVAPSGGDPPSADQERRMTRVVDGVAVIEVSGVLWRADDWDFQHRGYGVSTYARVARDIQTALASREVEAILLAINSPGGEVAGCDETAQLIAEAREVKPVWAHVDGQCSSAAYYLASAASQIIGNHQAMVGSIGAVIGLYDFRGYLEQLGITEYEFVSAVSPDKRPDPATPDGAAAFQALVDATGRTMAERIAAFRGISVETLLEASGGGAQHIGADALSRGLLDQVETMTSTLAALRASARTASATGVGASRAMASRPRAASHGAPSMKTTITPGAATASDGGEGDAQLASALSAERTRIAGVLTVARIALPADVQTAIAEGHDVGAFAIARAEAQAKAEAEGKAKHRQTTEAAEALIAAAVPPIAPVDSGNAQPTGLSEEQAYAQRLKASAERLGHTTPSQERAS